MTATFKTMSKEEKADFIQKLRDDISNLEIECGDWNMAKDKDEEGAVLQLHD